MSAIGEEKQVDARVALRSLGDLYKAVPMERRHSIENAALELARFVADTLSAAEVASELGWLEGGISR